MKYRTLGDGLKVSALGIGCMPMIREGNILYGSAADPDEAIKTIDNRTAEKEKELLAV